VLHDSVTRPLGRWLGSEFVFEESQGHWWARFLFEPPLGELDNTGGIDVLIGGDPDHYDVALQRRAELVIADFPGIADRVVSYLCGQTALDLEGRIIDLTLDAHCRIRDNWCISWIECMNQSSAVVDVVCHLASDDWGYVCWRVSLVGGHPTALVGETW
jgi:hypothetical protein